MSEFSLPRRRSRRAEHRAPLPKHGGLGSRIVVFGELISLHVGYYAGAVLGFFWFPVSTDPAAADAVLFGRIWGSVLIVGCVVGMFKIRKAVRLLPDGLAWFAMFTGCIMGTVAGICIFIRFMGAVP